MIGTMRPATSDYCTADETSTRNMDGNRPSSHSQNSIAFWRS